MEPLLHCPERLLSIKEEGDVESEAEGKHEISGDFLHWPECEESLRREYVQRLGSNADEEKAGGTLGSQVVKWRPANTNTSSLWMANGAASRASATMI